MTVMTSFIHSSLLPAIQLTICCITICQYIAILWVQYIDMAKYNIVTALVGGLFSKPIQCYAKKRREMPHPVPTKPFYI